MHYLSPPSERLSIDVVGQSVPRWTNVFGVVRSVPECQSDHRTSKDFVIFSNVTLKALRQKQTYHMLMKNATSNSTKISFKDFSF